MVRECLQAVHAEPAEEPAKGTVSATTPAEPESKARPHTAAPQELAKSDGPSMPPAPASATGMAQEEIHWTTVLMLQLDSPYFRVVSVIVGAATHKWLHDVDPCQNILV